MTNDKTLNGVKNHTRVPSVEAMGCGYLSLDLTTGIIFPIGRGGEHSVKNSVNDDQVDWVLDMLQQIVDLRPRTT